MDQWVYEENEARKGPWLIRSSIFLDRGIGVGLVAKDNIQGKYESRWETVCMGVS